jgi:hypothetical protein
MSEAPLGNTGPLPRPVPAPDDLPIPAPPRGSSAAETPPLPLKAMTLPSP